MVHRSLSYSWNYSYLWGGDITELSAVIQTLLIHKSTRDFMETVHASDLTEESGETVNRPVHSLAMVN